MQTRKSLVNGEKLLFDVRSQAASGLFLTMLLGCHLALAQATPNIASLSVTSGITETAVTITGSNFGGSQGMSTVTFNGTSATVGSWGSGSIGVTVPDAATTGNVVVTVGGIASNGVKFTVIPNITGFLVNGVPSDTATVRATVTINGTGFGNTRGFSTATLAGIALAGNGVAPKSWSDQSIVVLLPDTVSSGNVVVKVLGQASSGVPFIVTPVITGASPSSAAEEAGVTILGNGFGTSIGTVSFNGVDATVSGWTDSSINVTVPAGATSGPIVVTVAGQSSDGFNFTVTP